MALSLPDSAISRVPDDAEGVRARAVSVSAQFLLEPERQLTLDGRAEPLLAAAPFHAEADAAESPSTYAQQAELFGWPQAALPFHAPVDGKPPDECLRGWRAKCDAHGHDYGDQFRVVPECCAVSHCESSREGNDAERSRDLWNGTRRKGRERIGLRHVVGEASLAVLVVTLPPHLRPAASVAKVKLKQWERATWAVVEKHLRQHVRVEDAAFYVRANIHPCGEDASQWKPHLNFMVPAWFLNPATGTAKRFQPHLDVVALRQALGEVQAQVFGDGTNPNCYWQYERDEGWKRHQAGYVPRTFPRWAHLKLRPQGYGLAHPRKRAGLEAALDYLRMKALPEWVTVQLRDGLEPAPISGHGSTESEAREDCLQQLKAHRAFCEHCSRVGADRYPEHRRTMVGPAGAGPPEHPPPRPEPAPRPEVLQRWQQFLSLPA